MCIYLSRRFIFFFSLMIIGWLSPHHLASFIHRVCQRYMPGGHVLEMPYIYLYIIAEAEIRKRMISHRSTSSSSRERFFFFSLKVQKTGRIKLNRRGRFSLAVLKNDFLGEPIYFLLSPPCSISCASQTHTHTFIYVYIPKNDRRFTVHSLISIYYYVHVFKKFVYQ